MTRNERITEIATKLPERYEIIEKRRWSTDGLEEDRLTLWYQGGNSNKIRVGGIMDLNPPTLQPDRAVRFSSIIELEERGWDILDLPPAPLQTE